MRLSTSPPHRFGLIALLLGALALGSPISYAGPFKKDAAKLDEKIRVQTQRFMTFQNDPATRIPAPVLAGAKGVILIHKIKAGIGIGGEAGGGVALVRDPVTGAWSAPGFVASAEGSWGLQFGAQEIDLVFVLMDERGLKLLQKGSINVGVDLRATAGPNEVGGDFDTTTVKEPVLVYSGAEGVFAGAAVKGGGILSAKKNNATYYGMTLDEILFQRKAKPSRSGMELITVLNVASGMTAEDAAASASGQPIPPRAAPAGPATRVPPPANPTPELKPFTPPATGATPAPVPAPAPAPAPLPPAP